MRYRANRLEAEDLDLGFGSVIAQTVHARSSYKPGEIVWQARFDKMYQRVGRRGSLAIDVRRIHSLRPAE